jgi:glycosyltransferase involved in cell wall biosynthesis
MRDFFAKNLKSRINLWVDPRTYLGKLLIGWVGWSVLRNVPGAFKIFLGDLLGMPISIWRQLWLLRQRKPDFVHLNSATLFSSAIAARLAGIPIVWHIREPLQGTEFQKRIIGRFIRGMATAVITISEEEAIRLGEDHERKVHVVYNPINTDMLRPERYDQVQEKQRLGFDATDKLVLSLGGVNPRKGTLQLVEAMQYVDQQTYLIIAGPPLPRDPRPGSYECQIVDTLKSLPKNKVIFVGNLEDVVPLLAACDILVFAGMKPHFPRPAYEAWQMRKPVRSVARCRVGDPVSHEKMGETGRQKRRGCATKQVLSVYREALG